MIRGICPFPKEGIAALAEKQIIVLVGAGKAEIVRPCWKPASILLHLNLDAIPQAKEAVMRQKHGIHFLQVQEWSVDGIAKAINSMRIVPTATCAILSAGILRLSRKDVVLQGLQRCHRPVTIYPVEVFSPASGDQSV